MASRILVEFDAMENTAKKLEMLADQLSSLGGQLKSMNLSSLGSGDVKIKGVLASELIRQYGTRARNVSAAADQTAKNTRKAASMFQKCESSLCDLVNASGMNVGAAKLSGSVTTAVSKSLLDYFNLGELVKTVIGSFGPVGSFIKALMSMDFSNWSKSLKNIGKQCVSFAKWIGKFPNFWKTNRFGYNYGTKNFLKNLFGLNRYKHASSSSSWSWRFGAEFKSNLKSTFVKSSGKPNWFGIIGVTIDTVATGYDNYKRYAAGEISAARGVTQTVVEVGGNLILGTAVTAVVAASLPATAPVVVVAAASGAVIWAIDGLTKAATGGDKGLVSTVAESIGWVVDHPGEAWNTVTNTAGKVWNKTTEVVSNAYEKGAEFFSGLSKKVLGTSGARRSVFGFSF